MIVERSGDDLLVTISGLMPDERAELTVRLVVSGFTSSIAADGSGDARLNVPLRGDAPLEVRVRRASGEELRTAFAPPPGGPTAPGLAASVAPPTVPPSVAAPSASPALRASAPFAVALEPADPPPGSTPEIVVNGLLAGEAFDLEVGVTGGGTDTYGVQADTAGSFRWRSPVVPGIGFRATAVRRSGERAGTALAAVATATPVPTEPPCVTTGSPDARTGMTADFVLGGRPMAGLTVEMREWRGALTGGPEGCLTCPLFGRGITDAQGRVVVVGLPPGVLVEPVVPDARYTRGGPDVSWSAGTPVCAGRIVPQVTLQGPRELYWSVTGLEISRGPDGALTLRWDPVPGATSYCLRLLDFGPLRTAVTAVTTGSCMGLTDHTAVATPNFRTAAGLGDHYEYTPRIVAFRGTDAVGMCSGCLVKFTY